MDKRRKYLEGKLQCNVGVDSVCNSEETHSTEERTGLLQNPK